MTTADRFPAPVLVLAGIVSVQFGGALAQTLVPVIGAGGSVVMRLLFATVLLVALVRPRWRGHSRRAWATVNKDDGGGNKSGSGRGTHTDNPAAHKGGKKGGEASANRPAAERSASANKAAETRKRHEEERAHH